MLAIAGNQQSSATYVTNLRHARYSKCPKRPKYTKRNLQKSIMCCLLELNATYITNLMLSQHEYTSKETQIYKQRPTKEPYVLSVAVDRHLCDVSEISPTSIMRVLLRQKRPSYMRSDLYKSPMCCLSRSNAACTTYLRHAWHSKCPKRPKYTKRDLQKSIMCCLLR